MVKIQKVLSYILMALAVVTLILSFGFMTNFHELFYNGTPEMIVLFKEMQTINNLIFNFAVCVIILIIVLRMFSIHQKVLGKIGLATVTITSTYIVLTSIKVLGSLPYYEDKYNVLDFATMDNYTPSNFTFNLTKVLFVLWIIISSLLLFIVVFNYLTNRKRNTIQKV